MEHLSPEQLERYKALQMEASELEQAEAHLEKCEDCRKKLLSTETTGRAVGKLYRQISAASPSNCLTYDQLADFLDDKLEEAEREQVESHLKVCAQCADDLRVLDEFRATLQKQVSEPHPIALPKPSLWWRLKYALTFRWVVASGAAAILLLIVFFAFHNLQRSLGAHFQQMEEQIARLHEQLRNFESQVQALRQEQEQFDALQRRLEAMGKEIERLALRETTGEISAPKPSLPLVALKDTAGTVVVTEDMKLQTPLALPNEWRERVVKFLVEGSVNQPSGVRVAMARVKEQTVMRSKFAEAKELQLLSPVMTSVMPDQIVFRWKGVKGAGHYRVLIADETGTKILWESKPINANSLSLPIKVAKLKPGEVYTWQVELALKGETRLSPSVRFWVLDEKSASVVRRMRKQFAHSALTLAVVYASYGLKDEAIAQIQKLQKLNPNNPVIRLMREAVLK